MLVYVITKDGRPLMPTQRCGKVRRMLRDNLAKVVKRCPFTIQLLYTPATEIVQEINLGVDAGSKVVGLSATTPKKVLYENNFTLRNDIVDLLSTRREMRKSRRNRKTRYRKARFDNHRKSEGWLAPSVKQKIESHLSIIRKIHEILPVSKVIVETASFDIQKIKNPNIDGEEYQQGEQTDFWNVREYVLFRDGHTCQCCKGKSKDKILNVHHIESRKVGGDAPNNLITLCETCHTGYHQGKVKLPATIKRGMKFNDATFMGIMRWFLLDELKKTYPNVENTYGYITKNTRIANNLPKDHYIDARCISGNPTAVSDGQNMYLSKKVRCHNRQIHKCTINKGGTRKLNQAPRFVKGFALWDKVMYERKEMFISGRRLQGGFVIKNLLGETKEKTPSKIKFVAHQSSFIVERMKAIPHTIKIVCSFA